MHIFILCMYKHVYKRIHSVKSMYFVHYIYTKAYKATFHLFTVACRCMVLSRPTQWSLSIGNILLFYKTFFYNYFYTIPRAVKKQQFFFFILFWSEVCLGFFYTEKCVCHVSCSQRTILPHNSKKNVASCRGQSMEIFTLQGKICTSRLGGWLRKVG